MDDIRLGDVRVNSPPVTTTSSPSGMPAPNFRAGTLFAKSFATGWVKGIKPKSKRRKAKTIKHKKTNKRKKK